MFNNALQNNKNGTSLKPGTNQVTTAGVFLSATVPHWVVCRHHTETCLK